MRWSSPLADEARRLRHRWQIKHGRFRSPEPDWDVLSEIVRPGDWVIDVGANVGHYTLRLAELVGPEGRVIAIEPIPRTFALLAANCAHLPNVSLLNVAILEGTAPRAWMRVPQQNYYRAHVAEAGDVPVLGLTLDTLPWRDHHISLIKIDAEGCDAAVLNGAMQIIHEQRPTLIVESLTCRVEGSLKELGYCPRRLERSPNRIFLHDNGAVGV